MNILLFGGSFNPPHLGHQFVMEQAFELIPDVDEVWMMPCFNHSFDKELAPTEDRLAMCNLLVKPDQIKVCPIEIDYQTSGSTYQTLNLLKSETAYLNKTMFPQSPITNHQSLNFSFLMGSDQLPSFTQWEHWQELLHSMHFYVYPRGSQRHDVTFQNMTLLDSPTQVITNISSTLVRDRRVLDLPIKHILPSAVLNYIDTHRLYI